MALQYHHPKIMDTRTILAITGIEQDFLPDSCQTIFSLILCGMISGVIVEGIISLTWTVQCENKDQMAITAKCYLVPSANTRLLSISPSYLLYGTRVPRY